MPVSESSYFTLRFCAAFEEVDFGQRKIRGEHMPVLEIALGAEDMMTALRGHPTGRPVPCTLKSVAGTNLPQIEATSQHEELELDAADAQVAASGTAAELAQLGREIASLIDSGRSGKAWKEEISARLDAIADTLRRHDETVRTALEASEARISGQVDSLARAELDEIRSHIDPRHLALLGHGPLTRQIPKDSKPRD